MREDDGPEPGRADARRNRACVLQAAEDVFARAGPAASMRDVAAGAGVGLGTVYRHFPTREALHRAVVLSRLHALLAEADALAGAHDAGAAFFAFFDGIVETAARNRSLADALAEAGLDPKAGTAEVAGAMRAAVRRLLDRAQLAGAVRPDLGMPELLALLAAACLAAERSRWEPEFRARTLALLFDGLRPRP